MYSNLLYTMVIRQYIMVLLTLGVVTNLEDLIPSYMLTNCIMLLTQNLQRSDDVCTHHYVTWTTRIYRQLETFIRTENEIPNFLYSQSNETAVKRTLFRCYRRRFDARLLCCRKRDAMLLVARRIIAVLKGVAKNDTVTGCKGSEPIKSHVQRLEQELHVIADACGSINTHRNDTAMANECDASLVKLSDEAVHTAHVDIDNRHAIVGIIRQNCCYEETEDRQLADLYH